MDKVYAAVAGKTEPESGGITPGLPGQMVKLPDAAINRMAGLLEKVNEEGGRHDLYRLAQDLTLELDDVLPVVEAAELTGVCHSRPGRYCADAAGPNVCRCQHPGS